MNLKSITKFQKEQGFTLNSTEFKRNFLRQCRDCKKKKPKECFYKNTLNSTGYSKQCKSCARQYAINRRKLRKEI